MPEDTEEETIIPEIDPNDKRAVLVAADSRGRFKKWNYLRKQPYWKDFISLCSKNTPKDHIEYLERRKIKYLVAGNDHVDYTKALELLNKVQSKQFESIAAEHCGILRVGLIDEVTSLPGRDGTSPKTLQS
jgi:riboflavin biosynthesis pyrimidine reductase